MDVMKKINSFESSINSKTQEVKDKYFGTEKWMKAPNGEDTRLTESQWLFVRTQNFKSWFGDWESESDSASKAIDTQTQEPTVYYHGSAVEIDKFKGLAERTGSEYDNHGIYFSPNPEAASDFAILKSKRISEGTATVYPVFLNLRNPKFVENSRHFDGEKLAELVHAGFDGAIERGGEKNGYYQDDIAVIFDDNQTKPAI